MIKRTSLVVILLVSIGGIFHLSRNYKLMKIEPAAEEWVPESSASAQATSKAAQNGTATAEAPESARHAADEIARHRQAGLAELDKAVEEQEARVEERRRILATIVRTKGIIYQGPDASYAPSASDGEKEANSAADAYNHLITQKMQLESQINSLLKYDGDELIRYAAGLDYPDGGLKVLHPQYLEALGELDALKKRGLGGKHPTLVAQTERVEFLQRQVNESVVSLRESLTVQLGLARNQLEEVAALKEKTREEGVQRTLDAQDYVDAKRDYETDQRLLEEMKLRQVSERMKEKISK